MNKNNRNVKLRIGIMGCRGIPNYYGGYEQFAQFIAPALVKRGHEVYVYNSSLHPYKGNLWEGVSIIHQYDPEDRFGTFGQFIYDFNCLKNAQKQSFDILLQLGYTSNVIFFPFWPKRAVNIIHMDGLEWKRSKYSPWVQWFLKQMEKLATKKGDHLIADSKVIQKYLLDKYSKPSSYIPYGAPIDIEPTPGRLSSLDLVSKEYILAIARFVPENNLETIIKGYLESGILFPLVIVGNTNTQYGQQLQKRFPQESVRFLGGLFDLDLLNSLRSNAFLYFHGHSVGGTNPSLLEAMACEVAIMAHDNPFNKEALEQHAFYFKSSKEIAEQLHALYNGHIDLQDWPLKNHQKILSTYNWANITQAMENCFYQALKTTTLEMQH